MQEDIETLKTLNVTNEEIQELPPPILPHQLFIDQESSSSQLSIDMISSPSPIAFPLLCHY